LLGESFGFQLQPTSFLFQPSSISNGLTHRSVNKVKKEIKPILVPGTRIESDSKPKNEDSRSKIVKVKRGDSEYEAKVIAVISLDVKRFDDIWDFNVPVYHNYLSGGVIHHNSGKTYTNMMDLAQLALNIHPFKQAKGIHWVGIETWEQVRDILWEQYLQKFIPQHHIIDIRYGQDKVPRKIYLNTGNTIEFKAFNQGRTLFQGRAIKSAHYDEQCLHDFEGILHETQARLITYQGYLSWSMTPIMPQTFLEERIEELPSTDEIFHFNLNDNRKSRGGFIEDQRIDSMIAEWPEGVQATRIEGKFASYYGAVYKNFNRSIHVIKPFKIPVDWTLYRGIDFGFTNPFVCLWLAKDKDENWYVYREYYRAKTGIQEHIANIKARSSNEKYQGTYADPENAEDRDELRKAGIHTLVARNDVARGIELVQSKLKVKANGKPSLYIFKSCRNTAREMAMYQYPKGTASRDPKDLPLAKNDHTLDVIRYILYTVARPRKKGSVVA